MKFFRKARRHFYGSGFTMVELLVGISVLTILTTIVLIDFRHVRSTARDGSRKEGVSALTSAVNLYTLTRGSQFIEKKDQSCNLPGIPGQDNDPSVPLTDPGCAGANGRSFGKVNFTGSHNGYTYSKSISSVLREDGFMTKDAVDPQYKANDPIRDYTLIRCETNWTQSFDKTSEYFGIWAIMENPQNDTVRDNTNRTCGGSAAKAKAQTADPGFTDYDFALFTNPDNKGQQVSTKTFAEVACYTYLSTDEGLVLVPSACTGGGGTPTPTPSPTPTCLVVSHRSFWQSLLGIQKVSAASLIPFDPEEGAGGGGRPSPTPTPTPTPTCAPTSLPTGTAPTATPTTAFPSATVPTDETVDDEARIADNPVDSEVAAPPDIVTGVGERYAQGNQTVTN